MPERKRPSIMIKGSILQEEIMFLNVYIPNQSLTIHETNTNRADRIKRHTYSYSWRFQHPPLATLVTLRHKISKYTQYLNAINQQDVINTCRTQKNIHFFPSILRCLTKINHIVGQNSNLNNYKEPKSYIVCIL